MLSCLILVVKHSNIRLSMENLPLFKLQNVTLLVIAYKYTCKISASNLRSSFKIVHQVNITLRGAKYVCLSYAQPNVRMLNLKKNRLGLALPSEIFFTASYLYHNNYKTKQMVLRIKNSMF